MIGWWKSYFISISFITTLFKCISKDSHRKLILLDIHQVLEIYRQYKSSWYNYNNFIKQNKKDLLTIIKIYRVTDLTVFLSYLLSYQYFKDYGCRVFILTFISRVVLRLTTSWLSAGSSFKLFFPKIDEWTYSQPDVSFDHVTPNTLIPFWWIFANILLQNGWVDNIIRFAWPQKCTKNLEIKKRY